MSCVLTKTPHQKIDHNGISSQWEGEHRYLIEEHENEPESETENENAILSLYKDIERITKEKEIERISKKKNIPEKIYFYTQYKTNEKPHLPHGYKLTFKTTHKTSNRTLQINDVAMLCCYDPKKTKQMIMLEIDEDNHFTMKISRFEKYISNKEIIIEKITF